MTSTGQASRLLTDYLAVTSLEHVACGVYIWEWATSLSYELEFITGRRPWKRTLWPYIICRYCVLGTVINLLVVLNDQTPLNCRVWVKFEILLPYTGLLMASFLIVIRVTAIWNRHPVVVALSAASILAQLGLLVYSVTIAAVAPGAELAQGCVLLNSVQASLPALAMTFAIDTLLLLLMLVGLYMRREACRFGFWTFLFKQNLVWIALATAAELPTIIILSLSLNNALHQLLQTPEVIIMTLAATNMYRALTGFSDEHRSSLPSNNKPIPLSVLAHSTSRTWGPNNPTVVQSSRAIEIEVRVEREREDEAAFSQRSRGQ